ncbi:hypothetical protein G4X40_14145 [Rhodococcus sp. D2-41]|nr:hypothetical protein [Rhodococcus sp. D2-41]MDG3011293.1 hypothetical protein [Rhodococcus sp. D2-41]
MALYIGVGAYAFIGAYVLIDRHTAHSTLALQVTVPSDTGFAVLGALATLTIAIHVAAWATEPDKHPARSTMMRSHQYLLSLVGLVISAIAVITVLGTLFDAPNSTNAIVIIASLGLGFAVCVFSATAVAAMDPETVTAISRGDDAKKQASLTNGIEYVLPDGRNVPQTRKDFVVRALLIPAPLAVAATLIIFAVSVAAGHISKWSLQTIGLVIVMMYAVASLNALLVWGWLYARAARSASGLAGMTLGTAFWLATVGLASAATGWPDAAGITALFIGPLVVLSAWSWPRKTTTGALGWITQRGLRPLVRARMAQRLRRLESVASSNDDAPGTCQSD